MIRALELYRILQPHFEADNTIIPVVKGSKINEIKRIEQTNYIIPSHRSKFVFCPIVWNESLDYQYDLAKTMYSG